MKAGCSAQAASECEYEALRAAALRTAARCLPNVVVAPTFGELLAAQPALAVGFVRDAALAAKCPCEPDELFLPDSVLAAAGLDSKAAVEDPDNRFFKMWAGSGAPARYLAACERRSRARRSGAYARYRTEPPGGDAGVGVRGPGWARGGAPVLRCAPEPGSGVRAGGGPAGALRPLRPVPPADRALALRLDTPGDSPATRPSSVAEAAAQLAAWQELQALNRRAMDDGEASGAGSGDEDEGEEEEGEEEDEDGDDEEEEEGRDDVDDDEEGGDHDAGEEGANEAEGEV